MREYEFDADRIVARTQGREGWRREAHRQLEGQRWDHPDPVPSSREQRLLSAAERLEDELGAERAGNEAYEQYRVQGRTKDGRRLPSPPKPYQPPEVPEGKVNITDPDSKVIPDGMFFVQGYNAQAAVNEQQIVLAAEITNSSTDFSQLDPMVTATLQELERAGVPQRPEVIAADAGYWNEQHIDEIVANKHIQVLVAPGQRQPRHPAQDLDGRALRLDASRAGLRRRRAAIPKTKADRRARVRPHQTQQRSHQVPQTRQSQSTHRVAVTHDDPQPHQALQPPNSRSGGLKQPPPGEAAPHSAHVTNDPTTTAILAHSAERLRNSLGYKQQRRERRQLAAPETVGARSSRHSPRCRAGSRVRRLSACWTRPYLANSGLPDRRVVSGACWWRGAGSAVLVVV